MNRSRLRFAECCLIAFCILSCTACLKIPNEGIEIGNPKPEEQPTEGQPIRIVPENMDETYEIIPLDGQIALVRQLSSIEPAHVLNIVTVPYSLNDNVLAIEARFINGRRIAVTANLPESGSSIDGTLTVDGNTVEACFEISGRSPSCPSNTVMTKTEDLVLSKVQPPTFFSGSEGAPTHHGKGIADFEDTINPHTVEPATNYAMMFDDPESGNHCDENDRLCKISPKDVVDLPEEKTDQEEDSPRRARSDTPPLLDFQKEE